MVLFQKKIPTYNVHALDISPKLICLCSSNPVSYETIFGHKYLPQKVIFMIRRRLIWDWLDHLFLSAGYIRRTVQCMWDGITYVLNPKVGCESDMKNQTPEGLFLVLKKANCCGWFIAMGSTSIKPIRIMDMEGSARTPSQRVTCDTKFTDILDVISRCMLLRVNALLIAKCSIETFTCMPA